MESIFTTRMNGTIALTTSLDRNKVLMQDKTLYKFIWVKSGFIRLSIDYIDFCVEKDEIVALTPLHNIVFREIQGEFISLVFNTNFYCIFGHDNEVSCNGLLFNGSANLCKLTLGIAESSLLSAITDNMLNEYNIVDSLREEMLRILLKRFIILCTRIARSQIEASIDINESEIELVRQFYVLVDVHFRTKKQVSEYAHLLNKSPKTISNVFSKFHSISPLKVIHSRVDAEAKRLLLYSGKSAKEIAYILGFEDIASFSRFFTSFNNGKTISQFKSDLV